MSFYLHIESAKPMAGSTNQRLYFFERILDMHNHDDVLYFLAPFLQAESAGSEPDYEYTHKMGKYVILRRCAKSRWLRTANSVVSADLLRKLQIAAYDWRQREIYLAGKYRALIIYPNKTEYWQALIKKILAQPNKYPPLTGIDKVLFALTWHNAKLFWNEGEATTDYGDLRDRPTTMTRTVPMPKHAIPPDPAINYSIAHFNDLWRTTLYACRQRLSRAA